MGFRFRRSIGLGKGLRLNLGKTGPSLSIGRRGFTYNINSKGGRSTVGLPGTGMSYSTSRRPITFGGIVVAVIVVVVVVALSR